MSEPDIAEGSTVDELKRHLAEAREQQAATAEILKVIASSPTDVQAVFEAIALSAMRLVGGHSCSVTRVLGSHLHLVALTSTDPAGDEVVRSRYPMSLEGQLPMLDVLRTAKTLLVRDTETDPLFPEDGRKIARARGFRTIVFVPILRNGAGVGVIHLAAVQPNSLTDSHVRMLESFADQAVIAIENGRLFNETKEALAHQTAAADVLQVIANSVADVQPVFEQILDCCESLMPNDEIIIDALGEDGMLHWRAGRGLDPVKAREPYPVAPPDLSAEYLARAVVSYANTMYGDGVPQRIRDAVSAYGKNGSLIEAAMVSKGRLIGTITAARLDLRGYTAREERLLKTFADQAVIAIENARLFTELRDSLERLKAAQANLIQSEKMASLGQLTAGIAHEIKNPLNFVNNFATLSVDLLDELKEVAGPLLTTLDEDKRAELEETVSLLIGNLGKIAEHGKRADGIVRSMLSHSRGGTGDWQSSDINALAEDALNLAYHGARAQDESFNITLERDFDQAIGPIELVPQDITRVILNMCGNGFYAVSRRQREAGETDYRPVVKVATRELGNAIEVRVRDNGIGVPPEIRDKLFQPFFTTKPTGDGTGLGLSISYDIVTQQHGGTIEVESEPASFTEFTVRLPRRWRATPSRGER